MTGKTTSADAMEGSAIPPKLMMPVERQQSNRSISRLIAESMSKPGSPLAPSPEGAAEVTSILTKLEEVEVESRHLLTKLFSLLETDPRLETYVHRRLQDPSVSAMWELVEQLLIAGPRPDKGVEVSDGHGAGLVNERFKVRVFDMDDEGPVMAHPPHATAATTDDVPTSREA